MSKLGLLIGGILLAGGAAVGWHMLQPAPDQTAHSMDPQDTSNIAANGPIVEVRLPAGLSAGATIGKRAFEAKCATCHGDNAAGQNNVAPPLIHKIYEPGHHADIAFWLAAQNGVRAHHWQFGNMPPVKGLSKSDVGYIASYIRELQRENGIE